MSKQLTKCCEPLQKMRVRLGAFKPLCNFYINKRSKAILLLCFHLFFVLDSNFLCYLNLMYAFIFLFEIGLLSGRLLGNSCSLGLIYVF